MNKEVHQVSTTREEMDALFDIVAEHAEKNAIDPLKTAMMLKQVAEELLRVCGVVEIIPDESESITHLQ